MSEDPRCCGTGTCIINADGVCWCGQRWNGETMCFHKSDASAGLNTHSVETEIEELSAAASGAGVQNG